MLRVSFSKCLGAGDVVSSPSYVHKKCRGGRCWYDDNTGSAKMMAKFNGAL